MSDLMGGFRMGMAIRDPRAQTIVRDDPRDRVAVRVELLLPNGEVVKRSWTVGEGVPEWLDLGPLPGWIDHERGAVAAQGDDDLSRPFVMIAWVVAGREAEARAALA